jgi:hypothetical protein
MAKLNSRTTDWRDTGRLLRLIAINAYTAYRNTLIGDPPPALAAFGSRIRDPRPGDIVIETSTIYRWAQHADEAPSEQYPSIGILLRVADEPFPCEEGEIEPDENARERVYYIQPLDGSVPEYRWTNADFIVVPSSMDDVREWETGSQISA